MSLIALVGLVTVGLVTGSGTVAGASASSTIYDSTLSPLPGNQASQCFECAQATQIGGQVAFSTGSPRLLDDVVVTLSSWHCQSGADATCVTTPGATFPTPLTLNVYKVGAGNTVGALIKSVTQTFNIADRPTSVPSPATVCGGDDTAWYDAADGSCNHGIATNVTFNFGHSVLPNQVIYGLELRTSDYGDPALGGPLGTATACHSTTEGCGYDSLNVALSSEPPSPSVGSDPVTNSIYWNTGTASNYCDGGTGGSGTFRLDQGCWGVNPPYTSAPYYVPAVRFDAVASLAPWITSAATATATVHAAFRFTVATTGFPIPVLSEFGTMPKGLTFHNNGDGTATISGHAATVRTYHLQLKATNSAGKATQNFTLVVH